MANACSQTPADERKIQNSRGDVQHVQAGQRKNVAPNSGVPQGLPVNVNPSLYKLRQSFKCRTRNAAPPAAVANVQPVAAFLCSFLTALTANSIVTLEAIRTAVMPLAIAIDRAE